MKAITVLRPDKIEMLDVQKPVITEPDQVLVRICATGICGSDVHVAHGTNPYAVYPRVPGHEAAGRVERVGSGVNDLAVGDCVVFEPITYCGSCYACRLGHHNVCSKLQVLGCTADGTFREYAVVKRGQVYQYDGEKMSFIQAALCEPYTIGAQANWRGNVQPGDVVLVHGAGPIGLIVADVAKSRGATVVVSEPNENRLVMAARFGADYTVNPVRENLDALIMEVTKGDGVNVVFEAAGVPALLEHAIKILSPAGRLVALTYGDKPVALDFKAVNAKELTILGTRHQMQKFPETIRSLPQRLDRVNRLITHVFPADQFEKAFAVLADKGSGAGKVILTFGA